MSLIFLCFNLNKTRSFLLEAYVFSFIYIIFLKVLPNHKTIFVFSNKLLQFKIFL